MRILVISNVTHMLLATHILCAAVRVLRQLADRSWEIEVDDDMAFALDSLSGDPDEAMQMICTQSWAWCMRCERRTPTIDDGATCAYCKLVHP